MDQGSNSNLMSMALLNQGGQIASGIFGALSAKKEREHQTELWERQFGREQDWRDEDINRAERWRKEDIQRTTQREDTAVRRKVADLKSAGLSPTLFAGGAGASQVMGQSPGTSSSRSQAPTPYGIGKIGKAIGKMGLLNAILQIQKNQADVSKSMADASLSQYKSDLQKMDNAKLLLSPFPSNQQWPSWTKEALSGGNFAEKKLKPTAQRMGSLTGNLLASLYLKMGFNPKEIESLKDTFMSWYGQENKQK